MSINKFNIVELSNREPMRFAVKLRNDTSETKHFVSMTHDFYRNKGIKKAKGRHFGSLQISSRERTSENDSTEI